MLSRPPAPTGADAPTPCPLLLGKSVVAAGGRSGGLPRPLRHPSGGRWVIHPSNGPGCGEGGGRQDRKRTATSLPHPPPSAGLLESPGAAICEVLGHLGICEQKEVG